MVRTRLVFYFHLFLKITIVMAQSDFENKDVFTKATVPRSDWETFKWMFFEPSLLRHFSEELGEKDTVIRFFRIYTWLIAPFTILCFVLIVLNLVWLNVPIQHPEYFRFEIVTEFSSCSFVEKFLILANKMAHGLVIGLIFGLVMSLVFIFISGLGGGLIIGLSFCLAFSLSGGLALNFIGGLIFVLALSLVIGLAFNLLGGLALGSLSGLVSSLVYGVSSGWSSGLAFGFSSNLASGLIIVFASALTFVLAHFRLIFYPFYIFSIFYRNTLKNNPYLHDEGIWIPMPWVKQALIKESKENPELALQFSYFLFRYRQLQYGLAFEIEHTATAALWQNYLRLESNDFEQLPYYFYEDFPIPKNQQKRIPSKAWAEQILKIRAVLIQAELQTAVVLKKQYLEQCAALVQEFHAIQLRETFNGREVYFPVVEHWQKILDNQIREVTQEVERIQSVSLNPYSKGNALAPGGITGSSLFIEREDLKSELSLKIQTAAVMPTFLLLGQRRTGKTSLLNFLPQMLDKSRYAVAVIDAQSMSGELSVPAWFSAWRDRVRVIFGLLPDPEPLPKDWLEAWDVFSTFLLELAQTNSQKIILCMEEYDESQGFHNALQQDVERGAALLARIRAFSQRQNEVIMMFIGATDFIDLPGEPRWSKYFVQIHIFRVEYLSRTGSLKLITEPVPGFRLKYAEGLPERIWELTQGHPHLLHSICSDLVDYANAVPKNPVDHADLDKILAEKTLQRGEQPFVGFWDEFCQNQSMRDVVLEITHHRQVDRALPDVRRLIDYKYVVVDAEGTLRMRVPLFEQWLARFGY